MEDASHSPPSSRNDQSPQPLPAVSQITPPLQKQMPFNRNGIVIYQGASSSSDGATSSSTMSDLAGSSSGGTTSLSPPVNAERRWHTIQAVHQSWKSPLTTASTGVGPVASSPPVTVDQLSSRYQVSDRTAAQLLLHSDYRPLRGFLSTHFTLLLLICRPTPFLDLHFVLHTILGGHRLAEWPLNRSCPTRGLV